ncbi:MAG: hypothetical protein ACE15C_19780 [Phycisphaerae bacterium]
MKRRIALLIGTFLLLLLGFGLYQLFVGGGVTIRTRPPIASARPAEDPQTKPSVVIPKGLEVYIEDRRDDGTLAGLYTAKKWQRLADGTYQFDEPRVVLYRDNQDVYITADKGEFIYSGELGRKGSKVTRGKLLGDVKVDIDRDPASGRHDPADMVMIRMDDVSFNNDLLELSTDNPVSVESKEADIWGKGLNLRWNEQPQELRDLWIRQGEKLVIKNVPEGLKFNLPGAGQGADAATQAGLSPVTSPQPTGRPAETMAWLTTSMPATAHAPVRRIAPGPSAGPAVRTPATQPQRANVYEVTLTDDKGGIRVVSGERSMEGARHLKLSFDWAGGAKETRQPRGPRTPPATKAAAPAASPRPSPSPARAKPGQPRTEQMTITWHGPLSLLPVGHTEAPSNKRYAVSGDGDDIVMKDTQATAWCSRFSFHNPEQAGQLDGRPANPAKGTPAKPVRLETANHETIECPMMRYVGSAIDAAGRRQDAVAHLAGPGAMTMPPRSGGMAEGIGGLGGLPAGTRKPQTQSAPATAPGAVDKIVWEGSVDAHFTEQTTVAPDGKKSTKQRITDAVFQKGVKLTEAATGNYVECDRLQTWLTADPEGRTYPSKAVATGNVLARQDAADIKGDEMTVQFGEFREVQPDGKIRRRIDATQLTAVGRPVIVTDRNDPKQPITASGETITSELIKAVGGGKDTRNATIYGRPATATQPAVPAIITQVADPAMGKGVNTISGPEIHLSQKNESAVVIGPGALSFLYNRDLNGRELPEGRPVSAEWSRRMEYQGKQNTAYFEGDGNKRVSFITEYDRMDCGTMRLTFTSSTEPDLAAGAPMAATEPASGPRRMALRMDMGRKQLVKVEADKKVDLVSHRVATVVEPGRWWLRGLRPELHRCVLGPDIRISTDITRYQWLLQRVSVWGDTLIFNPPQKGVEATEPTISMPGPGQMLVEDFRAPRSPAGQKRSSSDVTGGGIESPSQTWFKWRKSMQWDQASRMVTMVGDLRADAQPGGVQMKHRSGDKLLMLQNMNRRFWPELKGGRASDLSCQQMIAVFGPPRAGAARTVPVAGAVETGPSIGELEQFTAIRDVDIIDGPTEVVGQQVLYQKYADGTPDTGRMDIWGFLKGAPRQNASLNYEDVTAKTARHMEAPEIHCILKDGRVISAKAETITAGAGSR